MMERRSTLPVANGNKYLFNLSLHLDIVSLKASTKRISSSNGRFGGAQNKPTGDKERR